MEDIPQLTRGQCRDKVRLLINVRGAGSQDGNLLAKYMASILADFDWQTRNNFDLRAERVYNEELTHAILLHFKDRTEAQMRQLADSFSFDSCRPNAAEAAVF